MNGRTLHRVGYRALLLIRAVAVIGGCAGEDPRGGHPPAVTVPTTPPPARAPGLWVFLPALPRPPARLARSSMTARATSLAAAIAALLPRRPTHRRRLLPLRPPRPRCLATSPRRRAPPRRRRCVPPA